MLLSRRSILAACGAAALPGAAGAAVFAGDMTIGAAEAPVQLVEYASLTCPHCAVFHAEVFPRLKAEYIDTRLIGFTLREFPTAPAPVSVAMFQLARCGNAAAATYFERVGVLFQQQRAILGNATGQGIVDALVAIGQAWSLSQEQVMAAIMDQAAVARIQAVVSDGVERFGIRGTPSMVLNEQPLRGPSSVTYVGLSDALNAALR